jgi:hypothetical protein
LLLLLLLQLHALQLLLQQIKLLLQLLDLLLLLLLLLLLEVLGLLWLQGNPLRTKRPTLLQNGSLHGLVPRMSTQHQLLWA